MDSKTRVRTNDGIDGKDSVGLYLESIAKTPLLNAEEEVYLARRIEAGQFARAILDGRVESKTDASREDLELIAQDGDEAMQHFLRANLRLVVSVARKYGRSQMPLLDLVQEGNTGLIRAVEKFDYAKGFKFSTYATFWIRQAIGRALDQKASLVRLPGDRSASLRAALRQVSGDGDELDDENAHLHRLTTPTSLDRTIGDDDGSELVDLLADQAAGPEELTIAAEEDRIVTSLLDVLDNRARFAVEARFGLHDGRKRSYREVGEELGVTAEAARRMVKRAVHTVRIEAEARIDAA